MEQIHEPASSSASTSATASTSNEPDKIEEVDIGLAVRHFAEGTRNMLVQDYSSAVTCFQEACKLFDAKYGIGAPECGDVYLQYGSALLELARLETGVIDGVVHTNVNEESDSEGNEENEENEDEDDEEANENSDEGTKANENESKDASEKEEVKANTDEDIELSDEDKKEADAKTEVQITQAQESEANTSQVLNDCQPSTSKEVEKEEEEEDDNEASNIEVAWEVLCLAKQVFSNEIEQEKMKLKLAETLQKLGEICIEWENNQSAADTLTQCLTLRKEVLSEDDRLIAETYYHLGLAFSFDNQFDKANDCYRSAIEVIENRIENQRKIIASSDDNDVIESTKREIQQLEELLPEMRLKIEDSKDQMTSKDIVQKALQEEDKLNDDSSPVKNNETNDKPVNNISHLIKRKRNESEEGQNPSKVLCSNGHNVLNDNKDLKQ